MKEKMTLIPVTRWAKLKEDKEGHRNQRLSARMAMTAILLFRGVVVARRVIQAPKEADGGAVANIPTQASWPVIRVGSDGGVMRGCGDRFGRPSSRVAYRGCSFLVGCNCSCRDHDGKLAGQQGGAAMQLRTIKLLLGM